ncbi:MAG: DUF6383 domain-containing protein [Parabacteroides sp.]|nr:DUF6383 domain-containing protein [bacterium]MDY4102817.1 DUF6383 domain-containing protein [Parabacteroides sp.]
MTDGNEANVEKTFKEMTFVYVSQDVIIEGMESLFSDPGIGRAFKTATGEELLRNSMVKNAQFTVTYNPTNGTAKSTNRVELELKSATFSNTNVSVRPYVYLFGDKQYLTSVKSNSKDKDYFTFGGGGGEVTFASLKDKMFSIVIADKEVLKKQTNDEFKPDPDSYLLGWKFNPDCTTSSSTSDNGVTTYSNTLTFAKGDNFLEDKPEGLWIFSYVNGQYYVQNCESANKLWLGTSIIQVSESDNLYVLETPLEGVVDGNTLRIDSLRITEKTLSPFDGYAHSQLAGDQFDVATLLTTPYQLGVQIMTLGVAYVQVPASSAILSITTNQDNGLKLMFTPCDTLEYGVLAGSDEEKLKRVRYAIIDQNSNRYIKYDNAIGCLKLDESAYLTSEEALKAASTFYIKEKGTDLYELVLSDGYYNDLTGKWIEKVGSKKKVFANISQANLPLVNLYTPMTGDKFGLYAVQEDIKPSDNILNKLIGKSDTTLVRLNFISTMNGSSSQPCMLAVDADRFLVEGQSIRKPNIDIDTKAQGGLEYEPVNFSLILDTAYVQRAGVTTPLYYIAMPSDKTSEQIQQVGGKTTGYYLFAMTDSIYNCVDKNQHDRYCYDFWSQHNPRLRFVQATHEGDTIYIETANPSAKDTIQAGSTEGVALAARQRAWLAAQSEGTAGNPQNNTNKGINYGLFAFEANPKAAEGSLEYALWNPASNRYVTYLPGYVVLTQEPTYYKLDVSRPDEGHFVVANEPVVAEPEPFAVVGGIGQVEIRQVAGKQVHIYNILGKELAHRRLTSDREQIALPKGIAIVAVEGETPVKVIVQ